MNHIMRRSHWGTNLVTNGDFSNGTTGWTGVRATLSVDGGRLKVMVASGSYPWAVQAISFISGHKYYARMNGYFLGSSPWRFNIRAGDKSGPDLPNVSTSRAFSVVFTSTISGNAEVKLYADSYKYNLYAEFNYISVIDLTAAFGAGKEPSAATMDVMMSAFPNSWFNGSNLLTAPMNLDEITYTPYIPVSESTDGIDWAHANALDNEWYVDLVDPHDPNTVLGKLSNVTAISITMGYYTDAAMSATVSTIGDDGLSAFPHARLRIVHKIASENYLEEIFTGYISDDPDTYTQSETTTKYSLISSLGALTNDLWPSVKYANVGDRVKSMLASIFSICGRTYIIESTANDYTFSSVVQWKTQSSILTTVIELADYASDNLTVNGHGDIVLTKYVTPSSLSSIKWTLNYDDASGMIVSAAIGHTSTSRSIPGRYIVEYNGDTNNPLIGVADAEISNDASSSTRGYMVASSETVSDFSGGQTDINTLAKTDLKNAQYSTEEWSLTTLYAPMREGDSVLFIKNGVLTVCMAKSITVDCIANTMNLTLKGLG